MYKKQKNLINTVPPSTANRRGFALMGLKNRDQSDSIGRKHNNAAFTLIELIVVMAVIGILVLLAAPKLLNYTGRAREIQIRNDIKVLESKVDEYLINHDKLPDEWGAAVPGDGQLYDRKGKIDAMPDGDFKVVEATFYPETNLLGSFYVDDGGKVVYESKDTVADKGHGDEIFAFDASTGTILGFNYKRTVDITDITIPDKIDGVTVTAIADGAFDFTHGVAFAPTENALASHRGVLNKLNNPFEIVALAGGDKNTPVNVDIGDKGEGQLTSVVIPDTVTKIGSKAFFQNKITKVRLGNSVESIGWFAFRKNLLSSIYIPDSVTTIEYSAFSKNKITKITFGGEVGIIDGYAFDGNGSTGNFETRYFPSSSKGIYIISNESWKNITECSLDDCWEPIFDNYEHSVFQNIDNMPYVLASIPLNLFSYYQKDESFAFLNRKNEAYAVSFYEANYKDFNYISIADGYKSALIKLKQGTDVGIVAPESLKILQVNPDFSPGWYEATFNASNTYIPENIIVVKSEAVGNLWEDTANNLGYEYVYVDTETNGEINTPSRKAISIDKFIEEVYGLEKSDKITMKQYLADGYGADDIRKAELVYELFFSPNAPIDFEDMIYSIGMENFFNPDNLLSYILPRLDSTHLEKEDEIRLMSTEMVGENPPLFSIATEEYLEYERAYVNSRGYDFSGVDVFEDMNLKRVYIFN